MIEEQLEKLITNDPSVVEATLEKFGDLVSPDKTSIVQRSVFLFLGLAFTDMLAPAVVLHSLAINLLFWVVEDTIILQLIYCIGGKKMSDC